MEMKPLSGRRRAYDRILRFLLYFCAALTCALLLFIIGYIFFKGLPHVTWQFLSTQPSFIKDTIGILPNILNTVYLVGVTLIITLPLGVGAAIYLTEYARNRRLVAAIEKRHEERYRALLRNVETAQVFEKSTVKMWECRNCGHIVVGTAAPDVCPTCQYSKSFFEIYSEDY